MCESIFYTFSLHRGLLILLVMLLHIFALLQAQPRAERVVREKYGFLALLDKGPPRGRIPAKRVNDFDSTGMLRAFEAACRLEPDSLRC
jgi:hypothetical protein